jgi:hypothetical protein
MKRATVHVSGRTTAGETIANLGAQFPRGKKRGMLSCVCLGGQGKLGWAHQLAACYLAARQSVETFAKIA